jgi:hypothetical protein
VLVVAPYVLVVPSLFFIVEEGVGPVWPPQASRSVGLVPVDSYCPKTARPSSITATIVLWPAADVEALYSQASPSCTW